MFQKKKKPKSDFIMEKTDKITFIKGQVKNYMKYKKYKTALSKL